MFLHTFYPSPILVTLGPVSVHWYGLFMAAGILAGYVVARKAFRAGHLPEDLLDRLLAPVLIGGFVGARLYHVLNEFSYYAAHPAAIVAVWKGGLAIHGALIGGGLALWWFITRQGNSITVPPRDDSSLRLHGHLVTWLLVIDLLVPSLALGQAVGRWGNYFNQELYGLPTSQPWGIPIDAINRMPGYEGSLYFHPVFIYESLWLGLVALALLCTLKFLVRQERHIAGSVFSLYLVLAGLGRFYVESLRIDAMPLLFGMRLQQLVSGVLIFFGVIGLVWLRHKNKKIIREAVSR